jgi:hypothetical protein
VCAAKVQQDFKPPAIVGSPRYQAVKVAENILENDYGVADAKIEGKEGGTPKVRYKDENQSGSFWTASTDTLQAAMAAGRQTRLKHGSGLDILQANLRSGAEPDLVKLSKDRCMRIW